MSNTVTQMMPAAPGMYRIDDDKKKAQLIVMWVLADISTHDDHGKYLTTEQMILGLTAAELAMNLQDALDQSADSAHWSRLGTIDGAAKSTYRITR